MMPQNQEAEFQILSGWKEIANYLRKGVRTVQRYERELGLPIRRPAGKSRSSAIAIKAELDCWLKGNPVQSDERITRLRAQSNTLGAQFLQIDAELALTLSGMALKTSNTEKRERQFEGAGKAFNTIMRLRKKLDLSETEKNRLDASLERLKSALQKLSSRIF